MMLSELYSEACIPKGWYCYTPYKTIYRKNRMPTRVVTLCPYWRWRRLRRRQMNGYCKFLRAGDWQKDGPFLLWDQVKECGINEFTDEELEEIWNED